MNTQSKPKTKGKTENMHFGLQGIFGKLYKTFCGTPIYRKGSLCRY